MIIGCIRAAIFLVVVKAGGRGEKGPRPIGGGNAVVALLGNFTVDATPLVGSEICKRVVSITFDTNVISIKNVVDVIPDIASGSSSIIGISTIILFDKEVRKIGVFCD